MRRKEPSPDVTYFILMCLVGCLLVPPGFSAVVLNFMHLFGNEIGEWSDVSTALFGLVAFSVPAYLLIALGGSRYIGRGEDPDDCAERFALVRWGLVGGTFLLNVVFAQALLEPVATLEGLTSATGDAAQVFMYGFTELFVFGCGAAVGMLFAAMAGHGHRGHHVH